MPSPYQQQATMTSEAKFSAKNSCDPFPCRLTHSSLSGATKKAVSNGTLRRQRLSNLAKTRSCLSAMDKTMVETPAKTTHAVRMEDEYIAQDQIHRSFLNPSLSEEVPLNMCSKEIPPTKDHRDMKKQHKDGQKLLQTFLSLDLNPYFSPKRSKTPGDA